MAEPNPHVKTVEVVRLLNTNKAKLAFLVPFLTALATTVASWIVSGDLGGSEVRAALGGTALAAVASFSAWIGNPGTAEIR